MRLNPSYALLGLVSILAGCTDKTGNSLGPPHVQLSPLDGTTNPDVQGLVVGATVEYVAGQLDASKLNELAAQLSLRALPGLEVVPAQAAVVEDTRKPDQRSYGNPTASITLVPSAPLADRWYMVRLTRTPAAFSAPSLTPLQDGAYGARFHSGSAPVLRGIRFEGPKDGTLNVVLVFSEPVAVMGKGNAVNLAQGGAASDCVLATPWSPTDARAEWVNYCQGGDVNSALTLSVAATFATRQGISVEGLPLTETTTPIGLPQAGSTYYDDIFGRTGPTF